MATFGSRGHTSRARLAATDGGARAGTRRGARGATALPVGTRTATVGTAGGNGSVAIRMAAPGSRGHTPRAGLAATDGRARAGTAALPGRTSTATFGGN